MYEHELVSSISRNADAEFAVFKIDELRKSKEEIFRGNYRIRFYDELHEYLTTESHIQEFDRDVLESLEAAHTKLISILYDYYINNEYASIDSWGSIDDMIFNFCDI